MKVIVMIEGLPPAIRMLGEFLNNRDSMPLPAEWEAHIERAYDRKQMLESIALAMATQKHWHGRVNGNNVTITDFKTVEGLMFDEYAMENDR